MRVKSLTPLFCACLSLPLVAAADSSPAIAHKAILNLELAQSSIAALPSQAQP